MHLRALAAVAALLLAGCAAAPAPSQTTTEPGASDLPGTSNPPGTGQDPGTGPGGDPGGNPGGPGFAPQTGHDEATDPSAPGLRVVGDLRVCDAGFCVRLNATNDGPATYRISNICVPPWSER